MGISSKKPKNIPAQAPELNAACPLIYMTLDTNCFPLPLVPFEQYLLLDDRPDYPMTFIVQISLSGEIIRSLFETALEEARLRHPLLRALIQKIRGKGLCWVSADLKPQIDWADLDVPLNYAGNRNIDLTSETGLRIWIRHRDDKCVITFQFHHCCCDGIGSFQFIGDLLACYGMHAAAPGNTPVLRPIDLKTLPERGRLPKAELETSVSRMRIVWDTVREAVKWAGRRITPLHLPASSVSENQKLSPLSGVDIECIDAAKTERLRIVATANNATLNDLLLRDAFLTIDEWQSRYSADNAGDWFRIAMPTNLRPARRHSMPATNILSYTFLTRRAGECRDARKLLDGIQRETQLIKRWKLGFYFLAGVTFMQRIPGALSLCTSGKSCLSTVLLTNLGADGSRCFTARFPRQSGRIIAGNLRLDNIIGVPPLRPNTHAAFCIVGYDGGFNLAAYCDPHLYSSQAVRELLDLYLARLDKTAAESCIP
jgi:hypothetical protein